MHPELIACISAHAAVDKACDLLGIRLIKIPLVTNTYQIDLKLMVNMIGPNTILLYASAPSFPHGVIDPVEYMSDIAVKYDIGKQTCM